MKIKKTFPVVGMSCASCAARIDKVIHEQPGVCEANINYATAQAQVVYDTEICSVQALKNAVQDAGYDLLTETDQQGEEKAKQIQNEKYRLLKIQTFGAILLSLPIMVISMVFVNIPYMNYVLWFLSTCVVLGFGNRFYLSAWQQLKHGTSNMDTLVANSTGIAYLFSVFNLLFPDFWLSRGITPHLYFEAASGIIAFILLGRLLEERAKQNTSTAIRRLAGLQPKTITIVTGSGEQTVPIENARIGDTIAVKPGERIAVDGTVISGDSYVDESMLSGEPIAVHKQAGEKVYAGTVNQKGAFHFTADKTGADTMLAQIIRMVQDAQGSKAPVQKLVDKIAGIFVPVIIGIALLTFGLWCLFAPTAGFSHGLLAMITVLIIACPCALGLATPVAIMVGSGVGAKNGILFKTAASLETTGYTDAVLLDKTGTVTTGEPNVVKICGTRNVPEKFLLSMAAGLELRSEHPLARAILQRAEKDHLSYATVTDFEAVPGKGLRGKVAGKVIAGGNADFIRETCALPDDLQQAGDEMSADGITPLYFSLAGKAAGVIGVSDVVKESSAAAIAQMQTLGLQVVMLTGDNAATARHIGAAVGLDADHVIAGVLPAGKEAEVRALQKQGRVAMVGDGINDAPALTRAETGIAIGAGADVALDAADVVLVRSDLADVPAAVRLSRAVVRNIHQNLFWAFFYNAICIPLAAGVFTGFGITLNPMIASAAMSLSSVCVVTNALRLNTFDPRSAAHDAPPKRRAPVRASAPEIPCPTGSCPVQPAPENKTTQTEGTAMKKTIHIEGMMCGHCEATVKKALEALDGVQSAEVSHEKGTAVVSLTHDVADADLKTAVEARDYTVTGIDA